MGVADELRGQMVLLVVLAVHEHERIAIAVQVGGVAAVDGRGLDLDSGVEGLVDDLAREHVLELRAHEGRSLTGLHVLELGDLPQLTIDVEHQAVLEIGG
ncbi:Uncharacterised protein [Mycobacteroides abscessus subsp. abscessus]|nr:Uncharacterised protein [Mycobacteroides abscessus subsp. abscessus]SIK60727.1 Uncharacterised protein [Mycobacteroides abscessus subsp. abscessus]